jgi:YD repeat-containing protein
VRTLLVALVAIFLTPIASSQVVRTYEYDVQGRLAKVTPNTGSAVTYNYDPADNRTSVAAGGSVPIAVDHMYYEF